MEENFTQALEMAGMVLLFLTAVSCAFISYNSLSDRAELFIETNPITKRSETAQTNLEADDVVREVSRAEVILAILNVGDVTNSNERDNYEVQVEMKSGSFANYKYEYNTAKSADTIKFSCAGSGWSYALDDNKVAAGLESMNALVNYLKSNLYADSYKISYTDNKLIYAHD